ncbi:MAG: ParB/RepB/Spo0J family partition protein [Oscillospiraceae bacterium]|nr:ParB/RepB/Spo0J family partition protein [Oscillospiraceae bacterium]
MNIGKKRRKYKSSGQILMIPTGDIHPNPEQPRREISYERLLELAQSIDENGLLHPITVTFIGDKPMLVAGERRLRAAKIAGMRDIPCIEVEADESRAALLTLIENIQRENMNCFEEAEGIRRLIMVHGLTQEEAANKLGCAQSTVANRLRILRLSPEEREVILKEGLTERHARALLRIEPGSKRWGALLRMAQSHLNVAQSERLVDELLQDEQTEEKHKRALPLVRDVRLFLNTVNNAIDTMRRSGIEAKAEKTETDEYIEYLVRIPKGRTMAEAAVNKNIPRDAVNMEMRAVMERASVGSNPN